MIFYMLASMALAEGVASVLSGIKYYLFVKRMLGRPLPKRLPKVTLIAPCCGLDQGFEENIRAVLSQDYPEYEVIFVTESAADPAYPVLSKLIASCRVPSRLVTAGRAFGRGQKVHNLMAAVAAANPESEVLAFVDSDARPRRDWLCHLVAPLADEKIGAATGYRWYLPEKGGFWTVLRSAWNGGVATLLGDHKRNFAWGGSMALLKRRFHEARVMDYWQGALSDDYALSRALKDAGYYVVFVPQCLVATHGDCTLRELLEWAARQITITKVYSRRIWQLGAISQIGFNLTLLLGLTAVATGWLRGSGWQAPLALLGIIYGLTVIKGFTRLVAISKLLPEHKQTLARFWWGYTLLGPVVSWLTLYSIFKSLTTNRITWRGITYEMQSPDRTVILESGAKERS